MKTTLIFLAAALLAVFPFQAGNPARAEAQDLFSSMDTADVYVEAFDASVFSRRPTLLFLWASVSSICAGELPGLEALSREYAGRVNVVGVLLDAVSLDGQSINANALADARDALEAGGAAFRNIVASPELYDLMNDYGVSAAPTAWFVDTGGNVRYQAVGALGEEGYRQLIIDMLAQFPGPPGLADDLDMASYKTLRVGDRDPGVRRMRDRLYDLGYYRNKYDHDHYTQSTADIVALFQQVNGLPADGVATPETQALIFSDRAVPKP